MRPINHSPKVDKTRVDAKLLILGRGDPIRNGTVIFTDKILWSGNQDAIPSENSGLGATPCLVVMPGLWDVHVHYFGITSSSLDDLLLLPQPLAGARLAPDLAATLNAGFTSVRELGGYGIELAKAVDEGSIPGPNIYSSATLLSQPAGHGDLHSHSLRSVEEGAYHGLPVQVCDVVDEYVKSGVERPSSWCARQAAAQV